MDESDRMSRTGAEVQGDNSEAPGKGMSCKLVEL